MARWTPKEIDALKRNNFIYANRPFVVQLLDAETNEVIEEHKIRKWNRAHKYGAKLILNSPENLIVRIYDPTDVSIIDFLTNERVKKLNEGGGNYFGSEKEFDE